MIVKIKTQWHTYSVEMYATINRYQTFINLFEYAFSQQLFVVVFQICICTSILCYFNSLISLMPLSPVYFRPLTCDKKLKCDYLIWVTIKSHLLNYELFFLAEIILVSNILYCMYTNMLLIHHHFIIILKRENLFLIVK